MHATAVCESVLPSLGNIPYAKASTDPSLFDSSACVWALPSVLTCQQLYELHCSRVSCHPCRRSAENRGTKYFQEEIKKPFDWVAMVRMRESLLLNVASNERYFVLSDQDNPEDVRGENPKKKLKCEVRRAHTFSKFGNG